MFVLVSSKGTVFLTNENRDRFEFLMGQRLPFFFSKGSLKIEDLPKLWASRLLNDEGIFRNDNNRAPG